MAVEGGPAPRRADRAYARWAIDDEPPEAPDDGGGTMTETLTTIPTMERVLFLRRVPLFADLSPQDLLPIAELASEHSYEDADTIAEQGEPGDEMHIIVAGYVMVILRDADGRKQVLAVRSAGDVIGEMAVITSAPRMASLAAKGPVRLPLDRTPAVRGDDAGPSRHGARVAPRPVSAPGRPGRARRPDRDQPGDRAATKSTSISQSGCARPATNSRWTPVDGRRGTPRGRPARSRGRPGSPAAS